MILKIDEGVLDVDLSSYAKYTSWAPMNAYFPNKPGENHHCLLSYLVNQLPHCRVADLGTYHGASAIALASNPNVTVFTFDIEDHTPRNYGVLSYKDLSNIIFIKEDCTKFVNMVLPCLLILLDIAPHDGIQERRFFDELEKKGFSGIVVCDDIHWDSMKPFWEGIKQKKFDVTKYGHHSGTGVVIFDERYIDVQYR